MKEQRVKQVANLVDDSDRKFTNPHRGRIFSPLGISPTVTTRGGELIKVVIADETGQDNDTGASDLLGGGGQTKPMCFHLSGYVSASPLEPGKVFLQKSWNQIE